MCQRVFDRKASALYGTGISLYVIGVALRSGQAVANSTVTTLLFAGCALMLASFGRRIQLNRRFKR